MICGLTVVIEKQLHHTRRVTRYYVTREKHGELTISHEPLGWYRQRREAFFRDRAKAYEQIAKSLPVHILIIRSESVWIDYAREGWTVTERRNTPIKRLTVVWFYWLNVENRNREPGVSWYAIGNLTYHTGTMTKEQFTKRFGKGEG